MVSGWQKRGCPDAGLWDPEGHERHPESGLVLCQVPHLLCPRPPGPLLLTAPSSAAVLSASSLMSPCHVASHGSDYRNPWLLTNGSDIFWSPPVEPDGPRVLGAIPAVPEPERLALSFVLWGLEEPGWSSASPRETRATSPRGTLGSLTSE